MYMNLFPVSKEQFLKYLFLLCPIIIIIIMLIYFKTSHAMTVFNILLNGNSGTVRGEAYLALVIDDFGNGSNGTEEFINSDIPFTAAVMPNMPKTFEESFKIYNKGNDVILHMPMESKEGKVSWLGKVYLSTGQSAEQAYEAINSSLDQIYGVTGINNHMGSSAMENETLMTALVKAAKERNLMIVDSKTTAKSPVKRIGEENNVLVLDRDIFLDGTDSQAQIEKNLIKAGEIAVKTGTCIAIGHVGEEGGLATYKALQNRRAELESMGVKFVTLKQLIELKGFAGNSSSFLKVE